VKLVFNLSTSQHLLFSFHRKIRFFQPLVAALPETHCGGELNAAESGMRPAYGSLALISMSESAHPEMNRLG